MPGVGGAAGLKGWSSGFRGMVVVVVWLIVRVGMGGFGRGRGVVGKFQVKEGVCGGGEEGSVGRRSVGFGVGIVGGVDGREGSSIGDSGAKSSCGVSRGCSGNAGLAGEGAL